MELKALKARSASAGWGAPPENPFNGIESSPSTLIPGTKEVRIHSMELKVYGQPHLPSTSLGNPFNGIERHYQHYVLGVQVLWESIQWNWKDSLNPVAPPSRPLVGIHSMELKVDAKVRPRFNVLKESIQWNWKLIWGRLLACISVRTGIHSMELKAGWHQLLAELQPYRIHSMELKALCLTPSLPLVLISRIHSMELKGWKGLTRNV